MFSIQRQRSNRNYFEPSQRSHELGAYCVFVTAVLTLIPNPAISWGQNTAIQAVNLACIVLAAFRVTHVSRTVLKLWLVTSLPALITLGWYSANGSYVVETTKICAPWILYTGQALLCWGSNTRERESFLKGIFVGLVINGGMSLIQWITVPLELFPFEGLYPDVVRESIAMNAQSSRGAWGIRVWGLFNEPADMAGSVAFWVLLLVGVRLGLAGTSALGRICRSRLGTCAQFSGVLMLLLSRSGQMMFFAPCFVMIAVAAVAELRKGGKLSRSRIRIALLVVVLICIACAAAVDLNERISSDHSRAVQGIQSSWSGRGASIIESFRMWYLSRGYDFVFGSGFKGQDTLRLLTRMNVWSVVANSVLAFGFLGALSWILLLTIAMRSVLHSAARVLGLAVLINVFGALLFTISSVSMLSVWLGIVLLSVWEWIFPRDFRNRRVPRRSPGSRAYSLGQPLFVRPISINDGQRICR